MSGSLDIHMGDASFVTSRTQPLLAVSRYYVDAVKSLIMNN
jgi:hypothetical protein